MEQGTVAVVSWTRRSRIHFLAVHNAHEGDPPPPPQDKSTMRTLSEQLRGYIAEICSVPWIAGGDWNIEPDDAMGWDRTQATIHDLGAATQKHCRNIDWLGAGRRAPMWGTEARVVPGTDHVGVQPRVQVVVAKTLGYGM